MSASPSLWVTPPKLNVHPKTYTTKTYPTSLKPTPHPQNPTYIPPHPVQRPPKNEKNASNKKFKRTHFAVCVNHFAFFLLRI